MAQSLSPDSGSPLPSQHNGVTNDASLSTTVCDLCRQRKVRCNRRKPTCGYCFKGGFPCEYFASKRKRGLRAGYVSELEKRLAVLEREFSQFKENRVTSSDTQIQHARTIGAAPEAAQPRIIRIQPLDSRLSQKISIPGAEGPPHEALVEFVKTWFQKYHSWHPILHQPSIEEYLLFRRTGGYDTQNMVLKAIAAVILPSSYLDPNISQADRISWSQALRNDILLTAVNELSFHGLQAVLILAVLDYGNGSLPRFWNLIGICQRLSMQLGLRDLVVNYCMNYGKASIIPPRMLEIPSNLVGFEERIRAFWILEILDSTSTLGVAWNFHIPRPEINVWTPCEDDIWTLPEGLISMLPFGTMEAPGSFSSYVRLVSQELWHVHNFLQQPYDSTIPGSQAQWQADCQIVDERLLKWQAGFENLVNNSPSMHSPMGNGDQTRMSANVILTHCTLDCAFIALYQRLAITNEAIAEVASNNAASRCLQACNHMVSTLRAVADEDLACMSPQLIACVFVAARFYITHARATNESIPLRLDLLSYVLKACGQRWPLAQRLGKVLFAAAVDQASAIPLPKQFYDLQYSWPDIDDALQKWAETT